MAFSSRWTAGLLVVVAIAAGCGDAARRTHVDVYAAGFERDDAGVATARLWKNGVSQPLDASADAIAVGVTVEGDDVYVVGCSSAFGVTLWKNGVGASISAATEGCAESVAVSGRDVYVAGYESYHPMLWRNGVGGMLPHDMNGRADARALAVSGGDVYVAGWRFQTIQTSPTSTFSTQVATLWKNGEAFPLSDGLSPAIARSVAADGQDVYVVGTTDAATLWRNGVAQRLGPGVPTDVAVRGKGDVVVVGGYTAGFNDVAAVWQGGTVRALTNGSQQAFAEAVAVAPSGVYVAGYEGGRAVLWHDGARSQLSVTNHPEADAFDVAVVER